MRTDTVTYANGTVAIVPHVRQFYKYKPNLGAAIAFTILFALIGTLFCVLLWHVGVVNRGRVEFRPSVTSGIRNYTTYQLSSIHFPFMVGILVELIGYIGRAVSWHNVTKLGPYALQTVLLLMAPTLYAASIYMLFGRMAHLMFLESLMIMPAKYNTIIFVIGDVCSLLLQTVGGAMEASERLRTRGSHIVTVGLFIQIAFFGIFIFNEFLFILRYNKVKATNKIASQAKKWKTFNWFLITNSILILIRSIVRTVEFIQGHSGYISSHEWFLYVFDAVPMFLLPVISCYSLYKLNIFDLQIESVKLQSQERNEDYKSQAATSISVVSEYEIESLKL